MDTMTSFQIKCEQALLRLLEDKNRAVISRTIEGIHEKFIKIDVGGIFIYIYEDACDFQGTNIDERFENYKGITEDQIIENFLWRLEKYI